MNGLLRSSERIGRGLVAAAALVGLVVVVPVLLVRFVGWPLPTNLLAPGSVLEEVERRGISDGTFVKALALVVWIAWARFSLSIGIEIIAAVRHRPSPAHRSLGGSQRLAAALVTAVMALTGTLAGVTGAGATRTPIARSVAVTSLRPPPTARTSVVAAAESAVPGGGSSEHRWVVARNDSLWGIAEEVLSDGSRWREIVEANVGREMSPGVVFDRDTEAIQPGWELLVPRRNPAQPIASNGEVVLVEQGDTLASIAADRYGDAAAWSTLWEANAGRDFGGRSFDDPDLIMPGWDLLVPEDLDLVVLEPADPMPLLSATTTTTAASTGSTGSTGSVVEIVTTTAPLADPPAAPVAPVAAPPGQTCPTIVPLAAAGAPPTVTAPEPTPGSSSPIDEAARATASAASSEHPTGVLGLGAATLLGTGAIGLASSLRRRRLRSATRDVRMLQISDSSTELELVLRAASADERIARVGLAVRASHAQLTATSHSARLVVVVAHEDGRVDLHLDQAGPPPPPEFSIAGPCTWSLPGSVPMSDIAAGPRFAAFPSPALAQIGRQESADVFVDLEACGLITISADDGVAADLARGMVGSIALSPFGENVRIVVVGDHHVAQLASGSIECVPDLDTAIDRAAELVGPVLGVLTSGETTAALRLRSAGEAWEPVVIALFGDVPRPLAAELPGLATPSGRGLGIVTTRSVADAPWRIEAREGTWRVEPIALEFEPTVMSGPASAHLAGLLDEARAPLVRLESLVRETPAGPRSVSSPAYVEPEWALMVRMLGPLDIVDRSGTGARFERARATELVAWLTEHREGATRSRARAALWGQPIQDATFANVVSDARRGLANLVAPPIGEEWIGRTLSEHLPIHRLVVTDAAILTDRRRCAASCSPIDAIAILRPGLDLVRDVPFNGSSALWADAEGLMSNLLLLVVGAATDLAEHYLALGRYDDVFWATAKGLAALPGHEELIGLRMQAHAASGDPAGVRTEWDSYERVLAADPWGDASPSPRLVALRREIQARARPAAAVDVTAATTG
jgi:nucleoid-associated protein YgaU